MQTVDCRSTPRGTCLCGSAELLIGWLGYLDLNVEAGYEAARLVGLGILASLRKQFGTLERIRRVVKVLGVVNSTPDFTHQPGGD